MGRQGSARFARSSVSRNGKSILFEYLSGARYRVPLEYLLEWFDEPHEIQKKVDSLGELRIEKSRRFSNSHFVLVRLSDGRTYYVAADTVLMACEPLYEHFGGLTEKAKGMTRDWWQRHGPFRIDSSQP